MTYKEGEERTRLAEVERRPVPRFSPQPGPRSDRSRGSRRRHPLRRRRQDLSRTSGRGRLFLVTKALPTSLRRQVPSWWWVRPSKLAISTAPKAVRRWPARQAGAEGPRGGAVTGAYYSDRDGQKYEVRGRTGPQEAWHSVRRDVPRTERPSGHAVHRRRSRPGRHLAASTVLVLGLCLWCVSRIEAKEDLERWRFTPRGVHLHSPGSQIHAPLGKRVSGGFLTPKGFDRQLRFKNPFGCGLSLRRGHRFPGVAGTRPWGYGVEPLRGKSLVPYGVSETCGFARRQSCRSLVTGRDRA